jgi:hypothetical protein
VDGLDQMAAGQALSRGWELVAPLPFGRTLNAAINALPTTAAEARFLLTGESAYRTHLLFPAACTKLRADPRFVKLSARLGLVEYWLETQSWPDCAKVAPYDFRAECEKYRDFPKDVFFA